jgi:hypothetical protein
VFGIHIGQARLVTSTIQITKAHDLIISIRGNEDIFEEDVLVATDANDQIVGFGYLNCGSDEPCLANVDHKVELQLLPLSTMFSSKQRARGALLNGRSWQRRHGHPVRQ